MGAQLDRLRYEVFQNLFYSPMDTGFLRSAVATVLTVYGIETYKNTRSFMLSFAVATVLTVYGIETPYLTICNSYRSGCVLQQCLPFTVLKLKK